MNFGSFWHDIYQAPMNSAATKVASSSYNVAYDSSGTHAVEGAYMYKYGSYYYLFYSAGTCCGYDTSRPASGAEYKIKVCRSTSANSGFVRTLLLCLNFLSVTNLFTRLINPALLVPMEEGRLCWKAMVPFMDLVDSKLLTDI